MKTYIKPSLNVVELSVKESIAALRQRTGTNTFGFGSRSKLSNISNTIMAVTASIMEDVDAPAVG